VEKVKKGKLKPHAKAKEGKIISEKGRAIP